MEEAKEEIMEATYCALCKHGYAELSIQKIADELEKGKSSIYYHYDDKEELMLAFMDHMIEKMEEKHEELGKLPLEKELDQTLEMALGIEDDDMWELRKAVMEMQSQAPKNKRFRQKFQKIDRMTTENVQDLLESLEACKPEETAEIIVSCIEGAVHRKIATGDRKGLENLKNSIKQIAEKHIT